MEDRKIASQVLDYWFAIEFLGQDSYDVCVDETNIVREMKQFKKADLQTRNKRKQIYILENIEKNYNKENGASIYSLIVNKAKEFGMNTWGNLTFYIGKIVRQDCIEKLAKELGIVLEQAEKSSEYIPILSFQCNANGAYVEHTLSLSTVVWAVSQVSGRKNEKISKLLSDKVYKEDIEKLEIDLLGKGSSDDRKDNKNNTQENYKNKEETQENSLEDMSEFDEEVSQENSLDNMPVFDTDAITFEKISNIYGKIVDKFGGYFHRGAIEENKALKYQLFKDSKAKEKYDDDNYLGLSHDFFSSDLKMVKESIDEGRDDFSKDMLFDLINYICAPYNIFEERDRIDFVNPKSLEELFFSFSEILNVENSPLGKWPSRYMPALMQQVAINIAISNKKENIFEDKGKIFSVNGPPGTGKTTLLKEIIANNIIEKAVILSQYDAPDDAFEGVKFKKGKLDGAYAKYYPKWYKFMDDKICDYGILVTSCNNNAVENITKELPLESGILGNLNVKKNGEKPDSPEMAQQLEEIKALFSTAETDKKFDIYKRDSKRKGKYPEIYFTGYAKKLLGTDDKDADAWGLVAAPLGKKSNINGFYYDVLNPIWQDFLIKNSSIEERLSDYIKAKEDFTSQLQIVKKTQEKLKKYCDTTFKSHYDSVLLMNKERECQKLIDNAIAKINSIDKSIIELEATINNHCNNYKTIEANCAENENRLREINSQVGNLSKQEQEYNKKASDTTRSICFLTKIFRRKKYKELLSLAQSFNENAEGCRLEAKRLAGVYATEKTMIEKKLMEKAEALDGLRKLEKELDTYKSNKSNLLGKIHSFQNEIQTITLNAKKAKEEYKNLINKYLMAGDTETGQILEPKFIQNVLSNDIEESTIAQITNPWLTEVFNREREKLFYLALQMTKAFILSSKSCRANLNILGQYWGLKTEEDDDKIIFDSEDREAMIGSLFQTLFLLTPVISSTFASVGRLLRDMKTPGNIGMLIIDEAGQAQPQMAVGALYRSRKAIIVGDPKQVEPVVTDDLNLLKEAYSESVYGNYKSKSLSVQSCADIINPFGTYFDNGTDYPEWVGCPLLVHRRCISPMYEISNRISYNGIMKQQTLPPSAKNVATFIGEYSQWINVVGTENGHGDHYVDKQGEVVCKLVELAFINAKKHSDKKADEKPDLYIITPFTSVVRGLRKAIINYSYQNRNSALANSKVLNDWLYNNIGTVHKFQGKEANEVIFVLGCDKTLKGRYAVKGFVNSNIVNVAVTRAKYRLYMVGDINVWSCNEFVNEAKSIIDETNEKYKVPGK